MGAVIALSQTSTPAHPCRVQEAGAVLDLMVLADGPEGCAAVDVASGSLARAHYPGPAAGPLAPFDVVRATVADEEWDDPTQPEAVALAAAPERVGRMRPRGARRLLEPLLLPSRQEPLGFAGVTCLYWAVPGDRPSLAVVVPQRGPMVLRGAGGAVTCRFRRRGVDIELPVADRRLRHLMDAGGWERLAGPGLARVLGYRPCGLLVALSRPQQGRCYKVVAGMVPTP